MTISHSFWFARNLDANGTTKTFSLMRCSDAYVLPYFSYNRSAFCAAHLAVDAIYFLQSPEYFQLKAGLEDKPIRFKTATTGHMPVNDAWMRCTPIKPVSHNQFMLTKMANKTEPSTTMPTTRRTLRSMVMSLPLSPVTQLAYQNTIDQ